MSDNLIEWLLLCRNQSGLLLPMNFRRKRWALCRAMNWKDWPDDIFRHSYGSYHLAKHRNAALTAEQMGHKNARMLYAHYRAVVKEASIIRGILEVDAGTFFECRLLTRIEPSSEPVVNAFLAGPWSVNMVIAI